MIGARGSDTIDVGALLQPFFRGWTGGADEGSDLEPVW